VLLIIHLLSLLILNSCCHRYISDALVGVSAIVISDRPYITDVGLRHLCSLLRWLLTSPMMANCLKPSLQFAKSFSFVTFRAPSVVATLIICIHFTGQGIWADRKTARAINTKLDWHRSSVQGSGVACADPKVKTNKRSKFKVTQLSNALWAWVCISIALFWFLHVVSKNIPDIFSYNWSKYYPTFTIFDTNITEWLSNQIWFIFFTSPK